MALLSWFRPSIITRAATQNGEDISPPTGHEVLPRKWLAARNLFATREVNVRYSDKITRPISVYGHLLTDEDYVRLGFGCKGGQIFVSKGALVLNGKSIRTIKIEGDHPSIYLSTTRIHLLLLNNEVVVYGQEFALQKNCRGQGYARFALALQLRAAALAGIKTIEADAHGHDGVDFQGYAAWPELGFDGQIPLSLWQELPPHELVACGFSRDQPTTIREFLALGAGARNLWKKRGRGFPLRMSTDPRSPAVAEMLNLLRRARL